MPARGDFTLEEASPVAERKIDEFQMLSVDLICVHQVDVRGPVRD